MFSSRHTYAIGTKDDRGKLSYVYITVLPYPTISFCANGGSGDMSRIDCIKGEEFTLPENTFIAPSNMVFYGWLVNSNEFSWDIWKEPGEKITVEDSMTLYPYWTTPD